MTGAESLLSKLCGVVIKSIEFIWFVNNEPKI